MVNVNPNLSNFHQSIKKINSTYGISKNVGRAAGTVANGALLGVGILGAASMLGGIQSREKIEQDLEALKNQNLALIKSK